MEMMDDSSFSVPAFSKYEQLNQKNINPASN